MMVNGKSKGSAFEREICKTLSKWWSGGKRDDIFWRTDNSGGRATTRAKKGIDTYGQAGDVRFSDPVGKPLIKFFCIEVKRGYKKATVGELLDQSENNAQQTLDKFLQQVIQDSEKAQSISYALIAKRNRRETIIYMPKQTYKLLIKSGAKLLDIFPLFHCNIVLKEKKRKESFTAFPFEIFLEKTTPQHIENAIKIFNR